MYDAFQQAVKSDNTLYS